MHEVQSGPTASCLLSLSAAQTRDKRLTNREEVTVRGLPQRARSSTADVRITGLVRRIHFLLPFSSLHFYRHNLSPAPEANEMIIT
jgi:hypothetical protein